MNHTVSELDIVKFNAKIVIRLNVHHIRSYSIQFAVFL